MCDESAIAMSLPQQRACLASWPARARACVASLHARRVCLLEPACLHVQRVCLRDEPACATSLTARACLLEPASATLRDCLRELAPRARTRCVLSLQQRVAARLLEPASLPPRRACMCSESAGATSLPAQRPCLRCATSMLARACPRETALRYEPVCTSLPEGRTCLRDVRD